VPDISIDRMTLSLSAISPSDGERLARLIAQKLSAQSWSSTPRSRESVTVNAPASNDIDQLADEIVSDLVRQLNRTV
jgi:hypothetical protein